MSDALQSISGSQLWALNVLIHVTFIALIAVGSERFVRRSSITRWWLLGTALMLMLLSPLTAMVSQSLGIGMLSVSRNTTASVPLPTASSSIHVDGGEHHIQGTIGDEVAETILVPAEPNRFDSRESLSSPRERVETAAASNELGKPSVEPASDWPSYLIQGLLVVWFAGTLWNALRLIVGWRTVSRIRQQATPVAIDAVGRVFDDACREIHPVVRPRLLISSRVSSPVAAGMRSPVVILPDTLVGEVSTDELKNILLHEVAHVARRDQVVVVLQSVVTGLYWFHPLVLRINRHFAQAREEVCDNFVLRSTSATDYSRTLLHLAQHIGGGPTLPASVGMLDDWCLEDRVAGLLRKHRNTETSLSLRGWMIVACLLSTVMATGICLTISATADEPTIPAASLPHDESASGDESVSGDESAGNSLARRADEKGSVMKPAEREAGGQGVDEPLPDSAKFRFAGVVLDPNKQPVPNARVYVARINAKPLAVTDSEGRFEFVRTKGQLPKNAAWGLVKLVAAKKGFGIASSPILRFETTGAGRKDLQARNPGRKFSNLNRAAVLTLRRDDVPLRGRIIDLEGEPVSGVTVQLRLVDNTYARFAFDATTTDADGRFELNGIGRDRVVRLVAKSDRTEFSVFFARTENVPTKTKTTRTSDPFALNPVQTESNKVIYGAEFVHAVGPSVPVRGRVTDSKTGQPIAGVFLSGAQIGNYEVTPAQEELSAVTDEDGRYQLTGLPLGQNILLASINDGGYLKRRVRYAITDNQPVVTGDFTMVKGLMISGQVTDATTKAPIPGRVEYYAAKTNSDFPRDAVSTSFRTGADGRFRLNVVPGEGYLTFRSRRSGYLLGALDDAARAKTTATIPFVQTKTAGLLPLQYHLIQTINVSKTDTVQVHDLQLKKQPMVMAKLVTSDGAPVNGATIEEIVMMPMSGYARGTSPMTLAANTYQCREFTPSGLTDLIARHEQRALIGRLSLSSWPSDSEMPVVMKNPELAERVKIDRVSVAEQSNVKLIMRPAATLKGRVVGNDGMPRMVRMSGHGRPFNTDDDGRFELTMVLPNFPLRIQALHPDRRDLLGTLFEEIILEPGEVRDLGDVRVTPNSQ